MVYIPPGKFILGVEPGTAPQQFLSEETTSQNAQPLQEMHLEGFYIDRYEVTYEQFLRFKPRAKYEVTQFREPIRNVSWYEADAYCQWLGKRLPTEFEWEKAARGTDGRLFVWGNEFQKHFGNFSKKAMPVGSFKKDVSAYGIMDLNGNVSEWTSSWYQPYPNSTHKDEHHGKKLKVTRGGNIQKHKHGFLEVFAMVTYRNLLPPDKSFWDTGFRCAQSPPSDKAGAKD